MFSFDIPPFSWFGPFGNISLLCLFISLIGVIYNSLFILTSKRTKATVVDLYHRDTNKGTVLDPIYKFTTEDGREIISQSKVSSGPPSYKVGQEVEIFYSRINNKYTKIRSNMFFGSFLIGVFGVAFMFAEVMWIFEESGIQPFRLLLQFLGIGG